MKGFIIDDGDDEKYFDKKQNNFELSNKSFVEEIVIENFEFVKEFSL